MVKRIFDLCIGGKGPAQIAKILKADNVLIAKAYYAKKKGKALPDSPYDWRDSTIVGILERMDYCGHTVNFKSYSKSHKLKKRIPTTKEQQAIFYNTHEAIVEDAVFERVQELRANKRRPTKAERQALFSGLVYCADCGSKLHFAVFCCAVPVLYFRGNVHYVPGAKLPGFFIPLLIPAPALGTEQYLPAAGLGVVDVPEVSASRLEGDIKNLNARLAQGRQV